MKIKKISILIFIDIELLISFIFKKLAKRLNFKMILNDKIKIIAYNNINILF